VPELWQNNGVTQTQTEEGVSMSAIRNWWEANKAYRRTRPGRTAVEVLAWLWVLMAFWVLWMIATECIQRGMIAWH
jgi:hypothetical protein